MIHLKNVLLAWIFNMDVISGMMPYKQAKMMNAFT